jgi:hypothetical protein
MRNAVVVVLLILATPLYGENTIKRLSGDVVIDGDLSDEAWTNALRVDQFVEYWRGDNVAPPAATTAFMAYDDAAVYFAFRADDPRPGEIRAPFVDRDKVLGEQDYVAAILDTQNDRRSAVAFRVNARGILTDSVVNDANGVEDFAPDFFYEAVARTTATGWSAEMRIPLSSLRYPAAEPQSWGVILLRNYPRHYRYIIASTPVPRNSPCFICHAATIDGFSDLPRAAHFTLAPYSTAQTTEQRTFGVLARDPVRTDAGIDLKWNASSKLTVDATLNPDFSQIESDVPQLAANNRYALSYPEKRTFFLEGTDLLSMPIRAVYTRSITSPAWGIRATGQSGPTAYTILAAEDRGGGAVVLPGNQGSQTAPQNFRSQAVVGRLRHSIGKSFAGLLVTAREIEGGGYNRVAGPDFLWKASDRDRVTGQLLFSATENPDRTDLHATFDGRSTGGYAGRLFWDRDAKRYDVWLGAFDYSDGFRADNGFMPFVGGRGYFAEVGARFYPKRVASYLRPFVAFGNETTWGGAWPGLYFQGMWGSDGYVSWHFERERTTKGTLPLSFAEFSLRANPTRWLSQVQLDGKVGDRLDAIDVRVGKGATFSLSATARPTDHLELQMNTGREWVDVNSGRLFTAATNWLKTTYTFNARSLARVIAQYRDTERASHLYHSIRPDTRSGDFSLSALYGYRVNWQTTFFIGYGDAHLLDESDRLTRESRSLFMKVSYAIQR